MSLWIVGDAAAVVSEGEGAGAGEGEIVGSLDGDGDGVALSDGDGVGSIVGVALGSTEGDAFGSAVALLLAEGSGDGLDAALAIATDPCETTLITRRRVESARFQSRRMKPPVAPVRHHYRTSHCVGFATDSPRTRRPDYGSRIVVPLSHNENLLLRPRYGSQE